MADENKAGVGQDPIASPDPSGTTPPVAPVSTPPAKVDLTTIPGFSEFQSKKDREIEAIKAHAARLDAELTQIRTANERAAQERAQAEMAQIDSLDPAEQAKLYRERARTLEREREAQAASARISNQAMSILSEAGIQPNDPRLESIRSLPATADLIPALSRVVASIQRSEREALQAELAEAKKPKDTKAETARQVVQALDEAGVTQTSNGQSVVNNSNPNEEMRLKLLKEYKSYSGKGIDNPGYRNFMGRLLKIGVTTGDLYSPWS